MYKKKNTPASGKVKMPKWGYLNISSNQLAIVAYNRKWAKIWARGDIQNYRVVRLTGTINYKIAK
jgi:hypothetical protein